MSIGTARSLVVPSGIAACPRTGPGAPSWSACTTTNPSLPSIVTSSTTTVVPSPLWSLRVRLPVAGAAVDVGDGAGVAVVVGVGEALSAACTTTVPLIPTPPSAPWMVQW